jgi:hypothetical protein
MTFPQLSAVKFLYFLQKASLFLFILSVRSGFWAADLLGRLRVICDDPQAHSLFIPG